MTLGPIAYRASASLTAASAVVIAAALAASCGDTGASGGAGGQAPTSTTTTSSSDASTSSVGATAGASSSSSSGQGGGGACPQGTTLVQTLDACNGPEVTAPSALVAAAGAAQRGDTLSLAGLAVPSVPCAGAIVCTSIDAPTLLFSDEPETVTADGVAYADTVGPGRVRVYVYHVNGAASPRKFPVVVLNQNATPAHLTLTKEIVEAPTTQYTSAGKSAVVGLIGADVAAPITVAPGARVLLGSALDGAHAGKDELVHAILDFDTDSAVKVSIVSVPANADAASLTASLPLLANSGLHVRGTFPNAGYTIVATPSAAGVRSLALGANAVDPDLVGHSAVDGAAPVILHGNFGVPWSLDVSFAADAALLLSPRGGAWGGAEALGPGLDTGTGTTSLPAASATLDAGTSAIVLGRFGAGASARGPLVTGGGSSLPVALLCVPL